MLRRGGDRVTNWVHPSREFESSHFYVFMSHEYISGYLQMSSLCPHTRSSQVRKQNARMLSTCNTFPCQQATHVKPRRIPFHRLFTNIFLRNCLESVSDDELNSQSLPEFGEYHAWSSSNSSEPRANGCCGSQRLLPEATILSVSCLPDQVKPEHGRESNICAY